MRPQKGAAPARQPERCEVAGELRGSRLDEEAERLFERPRRLLVGKKLFDDLLVWRDDFFVQSVSANNPGLGTQLVTEGIQHLGPVAPRENATMSA